jgi:hypothetical protein
MHRSSEIPSRTADAVSACTAARPDEARPAGSRRAPSIVGRLTRQRYDVCRKYRECRKVPGDDGIACTWLSTRRAKETRIVVPVAVQATAAGRRRCRKDQTHQWLARICREPQRTRSRSRFSSADRTCLRCMRCRAGRKAFRALWKLRRILLRPLATLATTSIVLVRERGHLRSIESPWRQQCPKPLFRTCSVDAASAA